MIANGDFDHSASHPAMKDFRSMASPFSDFIEPARSGQSLYFANAAHGLPSRPVMEAMIGFLEDEASLGGARALVQNEARMEAGYAAASRLLGCEINEVAFMESGNRALQALLTTVPFEPGDRILVDRTCWGGTLDMLASFPEVFVDVMPADADGIVDVPATESMLHPRTRVVLLTWAPAHCGTINPAAAVGKMAARAGAWFFVDACQVAGQYPIDVVSLGCDGLAVAGRKWLRGPRGSGLLFASRRLMDSAPAFMADQLGRPLASARRYQQGEAFFAGRIALGVAIEGALEIGVDRIQAHIHRTAQTIRDQLRALPQVNIVESAPLVSGIVGVTFDTVDAQDVFARLFDMGVTAGVIPARYAPLDMEARAIPAVMRIAPHTFTTAADVDRLVAAVTAIIR